MFELIESIRIAGDRATGSAHIAGDHAALRDHFEGRPLVPGTWLVELAAQIAGPLAEETSRARDGDERWAVLAMIEHAKLFAPVDVPATLAIEATLVRTAATTATARTIVRRGDEIVLRADLVFALIEAPPGTDAAIRARHDRLARWLAAGQP